MAQLVSRPHGAPAPGAWHSKRSMPASMLRTATARLLLHEKGFQGWVNSQPAAIGCNLVGVGWREALAQALARVWWQGRGR